MTERFFSPLKTIENEILGLVSLYESKKSHPEIIKLFLLEYAADYLALWAHLQRFPSDQIDAELEKRLRAILLENPHKIAMFALEDLDPQGWNDAVEETLEEYDSAITPEDFENLTEESLQLFEDFDVAELALWTIKSFYADWLENDDWKDVRENLQRLEVELFGCLDLFIDNIDFFELASPYYLAFYRSYRSNLQLFDADLYFTLTKFQLLDDYVKALKREEQIEPLSPNLEQELRELLQETSPQKDSPLLVEPNDFLQKNNIPVLSLTNDAYELVLQAATPQKNSYTSKDKTLHLRIKEDKEHELLVELTCPRSLRNKKGRIEHLGQVLFEGPIPKKHTFSIPKKDNIIPELQKIVDNITCSEIKE